MPSSEDTGLNRFITLRSATALVVANMIGAGIFTTTGFQAADLGHPGLIYALWMAGGVLALCGALCFAELGAMMPRAGAEYVYIRESYGHALAFVSAFVALLAGFSAPIAAASKSFVVYLGYFATPLRENPSFLGVDLVDMGAIVTAWLLVAIHCRGARTGILFGDLTTAFKVLGIVAFLLAALFWGSGEPASLVRVSADYGTKSAPELAAAAATSLIFVNFCYLGWNGSAYLAGEITEPQKTLPRSLLAGTIVVTCLYLGLNAVYFYGAGVEGLRGQVNVGTVAAAQLFGPRGVALVTAVLCISILASISAMTVSGSRVYYAFGTDVVPLRWLSIASRAGAPWPSLLLQGSVVTIIILSGRVDQILQYAGFTLTLFSAIAVSCVIVLRVRAPELPRPFKVWGYPFTPLLFIAAALWTMAWAFRGRPVESTLSLLTVAAGGLLFWLVYRRSSAKPV